MNIRHAIIVPLGLLAACASPNMSPPTAETTSITADPLASVAALLAAAEAADGAQARAPMLAQLDALGVAAIPEAGDDPLAEWRREYRPIADAPVYRGRTLGPGYRRAQLAAGEELVIDQIFYAGERAEMAAQTRSGQQVVLEVTDAQAQKVCEVQLSPDARCRWLPIFTERFSITLVNRGTTPASVYLVFD